MLNGVFNSLPWRNRPVSSEAPAPARSSEHLTEILSPTANPSKDTLELAKYSQEKPEEFTDQYLTKGGQAQEPTNTGRQVLGLDTTPGHIQKALEYAKTSRLFRAMNRSGGSESNQRIVKRLEQIVGDGSVREFVPFAKQQPAPSENH